MPPFCRIVTGGPHPPRAAEFPVDWHAQLNTVLTQIAHHIKNMSLVTLYSIIINRLSFHGMGSTKRSEREKQAKLEN